MADLTKEQMVEFITREVMKMLGMDEEEPEDKSCCPDALVIGEADKLPPAVRRQYQLRSLDTYKGISPLTRKFLSPGLPGWSWRTLPWAGIRMRRPAR